MSERITDARLRELTAAMPDRMGGTLVDTLLLRELAAEILAARTDDARTLAAEAAARGAAFREREAANEAAMLRAQVDALTAEVARSAEAMRRQAAAVRTLDAGRAERDAYEQRTLRSLAGVARAALLAELDEARRERDDWNARATALEAECDALTARVVDAEAEAARRTDAVAASVGALDGVGASGDLAALARREAGPVTRRQWRGCSRCGQCFLLADTEAMPGHGVTVDGVDRACGTKGDGR